MCEECSEKDTIQGLLDNNDQLRRDVGEIRDALLPTEFHPDNGLINQVSQIKTQIRTLQESVSNIKTWFLAGSTILGLLIAIAQVIIRLVK